MHTGDFLTKLTIWLALAAYAIGTALIVRSPASPRSRVLWTLGCGFYLAHIVCAFGFFHHWSHAAAYDETARQTRELVGWNWGGGLFVNYLFTLVWGADVLWWCLAPAGHARRSPPATALIHGFFFFMIFNGTVVFGHGPVRWYGAAICAAVAFLWVQKFRARAAAK
jgi:hypothetical protein